MRSLLFIALIVLMPFASAEPQPNDADGWFKLGMQRHDAGDFGGAITAFEKAEALHYGRVMQLWMREARAYARAGRGDDAFAAMKKMTENGFANPERFDAENDLIPIRLDPRYAEAVAAAKKNAHPCTAPEFRQFDFWLGEWDVESGGQRIATSSIQLILDECVIFENYYDHRGYSGKSFSLYDAETKRWEQRYVDSTGAFHEWKGGLEGDKMRFLWRHDVAGVPNLDRMTYTKEGPDKVRQVLENSLDDGKTWSVTYDGLYTRRK